MQNTLSWGLSAKSLPEGIATSAIPPQTPQINIPRIDLLDGILGIEIPFTLTSPLSNASRLEQRDPSHPAMISSPPREEATFLSPPSFFDVSRQIVQHLMHLWNVEEMRDILLLDQTALSLHPQDPRLRATPLPETENSFEVYAFRCRRKQEKVASKKSVRAGKDFHEAYAGSPLVTSDANQPYGAAQNILSPEDDVLLQKLLKEEDSELVPFQNSIQNGKLLMSETFSATDAYLTLKTRLRRQKFAFELLIRHVQRQNHLGVRCVEAVEEDLKATEEKAKEIEENLDSMLTSLHSISVGNSKSLADWVDSQLVRNFAAHTVEEKDELIWRVKKLTVCVRTNADEVEEEISQAQPFCQDDSLEETFVTLQALRAELQVVFTQLVHCFPNSSNGDASTTAHYSKSIYNRQLSYLAEMSELKDKVKQLRTRMDVKWAARCEIFEGHLDRCLFLLVRMQTSNAEAATYGDAVKKIHAGYSQLQRIFSLPSAYSAAIEEMKRRSAFEENFQTCIRTYVEDLNRRVRDETRHRQKFIKLFTPFLPRGLVSDIHQLPTTVGVVSTSSDSTHPSSERVSTGSKLPSVPELLPFLPFPSTSPFDTSREETTVPSRPASSLSSSC